MDVKQLEAFVAVAKYKNFSKAARELFLTQPTVSAHIQNLEKELGTILFNRNNKEEKNVYKEYIDHNGKEKIYFDTVKEDKRIIKEIFYKI